MNNFKTTKEAMDFIGNEKGLIMFHADWCGPCQMTKPMIKEFEEKNSNIKVAYVNVDDDKDGAKELGVSGIPAMMGFEGGAKTQEATGFMPLEQIQATFG